MLFQHRFGKPIISMHEAISDLSLDLVSRGTKFRFKKNVGKGRGFLFVRARFLSVFVRDSQTNNYVE